MATVEQARAAAKAAREARAKREAAAKAVEASLQQGARGTGAVQRSIHNPQSIPLTSISKPETDGREYVFLELSNGLRVIVASDPDESSAAAAALTVQVGSVHEPRELAGLAHFCEHMVLHGTSSVYHYTETPFAEFLKQHGGSHNGVTTMQQTCFAFEVHPDKLEGAIGRFARFFSSTYFNKQHVSKEIKAIESEHNMNLQNDFRRQWAILLMDTNKAHPYHWGSGCRKSLQDDVRELQLDLYRALEDFHATHYSAARMTLAVVGTQSAQALSKLVTQHFNSVSNKGIQRVPIGDAVGGENPPFLPEDFQGQVYVVPVKDVRQMRLTWLLPWQAKQWRTKPTSYAAYLLSHEGQGSALSALKMRGLATGLSATCFDYHGVASTDRKSVV